jgi:hypothetical protein
MKPFFAQEPCETSQFAGFCQWFVVCQIMSWTLLIVNGRKPSSNKLNKKKGKNDMNVKKGETVWEGEPTERRLNILKYIIFMYEYKIMNPIKLFKKRKR